MKKERDAVQLIQRLLNNLGREARVYEDVEPIDREHDEIVLEMRRLVESAAAAPQPPVGEHWEVLAYLVKDARDGQFSAHRRDPRDWAHGYPVTELVDRQHVTARDQQLTALQARIAELEAALKSACAPFPGYPARHPDEARAQQVTK